MGKWVKIKCARCGHEQLSCAKRKRCGACDSYRVEEIPEFTFNAHAKKPEVNMAKKEEKPEEATPEKKPAEEQPKKKSSGWGPAEDFL